MADDDAQFDEELLSAYLDDELTAGERARVEERLAADTAARQLLDELRSVSQAMRSLPHAKLGSDLRDSVLRRAEREMLVAGNVKAAREPEREPRRLPFGRSKRAWFWAGAAIAAGLMLMFIEREAPRDAGLPREVALNRPRPQSHEGPLPPLAMRAVEDEKEEKGEVAAVATVGQPVAAAPAAPAGEVSVDRAATDGSGIAVEVPAPRDHFARSSGVLARGGAGGVGGETVAPSRRFVESMGGEEVLVVHVSVTPEAMRNRAFDTTLLNNSIEPEPESESLADEPAADEDVEVVMVEAAPAQVAATLAEIKEDRKNYVAIEVNEPAVRLEVRGLKAKVEQNLADLKQYNRGRVLNQQQVQLSHDNRGFYYYTPPQPNSASQQPQSSEPLAKANVAAQEAAPPEVADSQLRAEESSSEPQPQTLARGRDALDVSAYAAAPAPGASNNELRRFSGEAWDNAAQNIARRASQKLATKADMLQVLFVLQSEEQSPAAATTSGLAPTSAAVPTSARESTSAQETTSASDTPAVPTQEEGLKDRE